MHFRKTSIALAAMTLCGAAQAAPTGLAFRAPANNATISGNLYQSSACELTGSGIARVDFYLGSTLLNREGGAPWNCNIDTRKFSDGAYALRAVAYDSRGASASTQISVNIKNTASAPSGGSSGGSTPYTGTPVALPGSFAAADFDKGGQSVAYRDLTNGNAGGQYRNSEDVDIVASGDSARPYAVNGFQTGEWLAYTVNVPASGKYDIAVRAAHNYSSTPAFHVEVGGTDVTGRLSIPKTGGWSTYQWVGKQGVDLPAGRHVLKIVSDAEYFNLAELRVLASAGSEPAPAPAPAPGYSGTPFSGTPIALPKAFAAADFDKGGQNVAYRDLTAGNAGGQYRKSEDVDIVAASSALSPYAVNGFQTGEWLAYTVNVPASGKYDIAVNAATNYASTSAFRVEVDGVDVTGKVTVPSTGGWSAFQWVGKQGIDLAAGKRVLKVVSDAEYFNLNGVSVLASAVTAPSTPPPTASAPLVSFSAPANGQTVSKTLSGSACEALVANGTTAVRQVQFFVDGAPLNTEGSAPWNCSFDTTKVNDGTRVLRAVATDVNGKTGSSEISVNVANGTASGNGPTNVAFAAPASGATISSDINQSSACELTGTGISRVEFSLGGKALNTEGGAPWNCNIAVKDHASGTHKLKAIAYNASGGSTVAEIDVTIQNGGGTTSPTSPSSGSPAFSCSFESSPTDCGFSEQAKEPGRATVVSTAREGIRGVRLYTESGDNNVSGSGSWERNDLRLSQAATDCYDGKEAWWGHSILFPSDYNPPNNGGVVMDFHHTGSSGQANFHVDAMASGLRLRGYGGASVDSGRYQVELGPVVKNVWYDFVYHVKWSSGSDGFMHAWVNGVKRLTHYGPTIYKGQGCYLKLANYHDAMGKSSAVIHDRVRRGSKAEDVSRTVLP